jgi:phosphotransacetylase
MEFRKLDDLETLALARNPGPGRLFVAAHEEHILEAVVRAKKAGLITPILIGDREKNRGYPARSRRERRCYEITDSEGDEASVAAAMQLSKTAGPGFS